MRFSVISILCLAAVTVDAAAVTKRDCVSYRGNSWGCSAPAGFASNWNYCQAVNPNYPELVTCKFARVMGIEEGVSWKRKGFWVKRKYPMAVVPKAWLITLALMH
ncbi:hypothetical protein LA080_002277 [Diaporthe eres]|nr:hypothetical protein LA080_002277 [Diaporthe eres]